MNLLHRLLGVPSQIDVMRADLFMKYDPVLRSGSAAVEWITLESDDLRLRPLLVALLYARILIIHSETRTKLFQIVDELSQQNVRDHGHTGFPFPEWTLHVGWGVPDQRIWPWMLYDSVDPLRKSKVYRATLQVLPRSTNGERFGIHLNMAVGQERVLAPASPLIAITSYAKSVDQEGVYELSVLLWRINEFYGSAEGVRMGSESKALGAAVAAMRTGDPAGL